MSASADTTAPFGGLFQALAVHELTASNGDSTHGPGVSLRPRLPYPFETLEGPTAIVETSFDESPPRAQEAGAPVSAQSMPHASKPVTARETPRDDAPSRRKTFGPAPISPQSVQGIKKPETSAQGAVTSAVSSEPRTVGQRRQRLSLPAPPTVAPLPAMLATHWPNHKPENSDPRATPQRESTKPSGLRSSIAATTAPISSRTTPIAERIAFPPLGEKEPAAPAVEIHIGRIEVRAQIAPSTAQRPSEQTVGTNGNSLAAYLRSRSRGARS